jgi:hypothetical protein
MTVRGLISIGLVSLLASCCGAQGACARTLELEVKDGQGAPVAAFIASARSSEGDVPTMVSCPRDDVWFEPGSVTFLVAGTGPFLMTVDAGTASFTGSVSPVTEQVRDANGCPGCPVQRASITVR